MTVPPARGCPTRYFLLRCREGWDDAAYEMVRKAYGQWVAWADEVLATWEEVPHRAKLPKPTYIFGAPVLSENGSVISISIGGDPITQGALMIFEDGLPALLYAELPDEVLACLEVAYVNTDPEVLADPEPQWTKPTKP